MKIVVAGGAGFIGSHLCQRLVKENHQVFCLDNLLTGSTDNIKELLSNKKNFVFLKCDITQKLPKLPKVDAVFHLASPASPNHHSKLSYHHLSKETMLANTVGTLNLLEFSKANHAKFLFASTSEVYGDPKEHPQKETYFGNVSPIGPRSVYDESKRFGETLTAYFFRKEKVNTRIGRIFNTYGPKMAQEDKRMVVNFIISALKNKPLTIYGNGQQTRSLCFIDDLIEGLIRLMFYSKTEGEVVNLGSDNEHTVLEYAKIIKKLTNSKSKIIFSEKRPVNDPLKRKPSLLKAKKLLNWKPKVSLKEGLNKTISYFKKNLK